MKKIISALLLLKLSTLSAQLRQNTWLWSGSAQVVTDASGQCWHSYLKSEIGYTLSQHWMYGGHFGIASHLVKESDLELNAQKYEINPFLRYYILPNRRLNLFYELNAKGSYEHAQIQYRSYGGSEFHQTMSDEYQFAIEQQFGLNYWVAPNVALELGVRYQTFDSQKKVQMTNFKTDNYNSNETNYFSPFVKLRYAWNRADSARQTVLQRGTWAMGSHNEVRTRHLREQSQMYHLGYFWTEHFSTALNVQFARHSPGDTHYKFKEIGFSPELQYFNSLNEKWQYLIRCSWYFSRQESPTWNVDRMSHFPAIGMGFHRFIGTQLGAQAGINYKLGNSSNQDPSHWYLNFGLRYYLKS
jgi:opacity protein-like surface antigen